MRLGIWIILGLLIVAHEACADEKLPLLKVGTQSYTNVTVITVTPTDICFIYRGGIANAKLKNLTLAMQKHFNYNATNALTLEKKQIKANARYYASIAGQPAQSPPNEDRAAPQATPSTGQQTLWGTDLPTALNRARSENKRVLLDFTGSDWCEWCMKFDHDVLSTGQFVDYANANLILVKLDFPHHTPQSPELKQANEALYKQYNVDGYPTYILLNSNGKELGRQVGYRGGGPSAFIAELDGYGGH